jgi:hypothetical protein
MNAVMYSEAEARKLSNSELVDRFEHVSCMNNESDCRDAVAVLRAELKRRLGARTKP